MNELCQVKGTLKKKSVTFFTWGGSGPVFVTLFDFFQKHGLKWLKIAL